MLLAFHNDPAIKEKYVARVKAHAAKDQIVKGQYWEDGKGCAVGCTIHSNEHEDYETELGIPEIIARLEDRIFENLPNELAMTWPLRFLEAIPVGRDLSKIWPKFAIFLLTDPTQCASRHPQCKIIADKFQEQLEGKIVDWDAVLGAEWTGELNTELNTELNAAWFTTRPARSDPGVTARAAGITAWSTMDVMAEACITRAAKCAAWAARDPLNAEKSRISYAILIAECSVVWVAAFQAAIIAQSEKLLELLGEKND